MGNNLYHGDIVGGSLLMNESRKVADVLIQDNGKNSFYDSLLADNLLQKRSPATARRQAQLIRNRLLPLGKDCWEMIRDGSREQSIQMLLGGAISHSRLLGDFIFHIVGMKLKTYQKQIAYRDWGSFFEECKLRDHVVATWKESTTKKIRQVVFRILAEASIIDSVQKMNIIPFMLRPEIKALLRENGQHYALECLEVIQ